VITVAPRYDFSGSAGVGSSLSLQDQSTQIVPPVGLYNAMGISPCAETRSESYEQGRVVHSRADILFCQNCIHKHVGLEDSLGRSRRVYENRYALLLPELSDLIQGLDSYCFYALDTPIPFMQRLAEADHAPHC
jgi:hypothetical protein